MPDYNKIHFPAMKRQDFCGDKRTMQLLMDCCGPAGTASTNRIGLRHLQFHLIRSYSESPLDGGARVATARTCRCRRRRAGRGRRKLTKSGHTLDPAPVRGAAQVGGRGRLGGAGPRGVGPRGRGDLRAWRCGRGCTSAEALGRRRWGMAAPRSSWRSTLLQVPPRWPSQCDAGMIRWCA